jgi:CBS domain-containing protein
MQIALLVPRHGKLHAALPRLELDCNSSIRRCQQNERNGDSQAASPTPIVRRSQEAYMLAAHGYLVEEFMSRERITCRATTPIAALKRQVQDRDISALLVLNEQGSAVGLVSRLDVVLAQCSAPTHHLGPPVAADIMCPTLLTCFPDTPILEAVMIMYRHRVDSLLVVCADETRRGPFGVIAMRDIIKRLASVRAACAALASGRDGTQLAT